MSRLWCKLSPSVGLSRGAGHAVVVAVIALLVVGAGGCAGDRSSPVVVRVGRVEIDKASVDHWTRAIALGSAVALGRSSARPRQEALDLLISAGWAIGAAAERGVAVSDGAVARGLKEKVEALPNGSTEFEKEITSTGQTLADVKLEIKAALALSKLRKLLAKSVPPITQAQIADYYKRHVRSFRIRDRRLVDLVEEIRSYAHAVALGRQLGPGARFAKRAIRELVARQTPYEAAHRDNRVLVYAIFAATPGRLVGPVRFNNKWVLLVVRKLVPGGVKPLSEVKAEIAERLSAERRRQVLTSFLEAYRREWTAKTSCDAGFVVQKCSEYRGRLEPEGNPLAGD